MNNIFFSNHSVLQQLASSFYVCWRIFLELGSICPDYGQAIKTVLWHQTEPNPDKHNHLPNILQWYYRSCSCQILWELPSGYSDALEKELLYYILFRTGLQILLSGALVSIYSEDIHSQHMTVQNVTKSHPQDVYKCEILTFRIYPETTIYKTLGILNIMSSVFRMSVCCLRLGTGEVSAPDRTSILSCLPYVMPECHFSVRPVL